MTAQERGGATRRSAVKLFGLSALGLGTAAVGAPGAKRVESMEHTEERARDRAEDITLFLCGDVMPGRGIDQILAHPSDPRIHEPYLGNAEDYVRLAEAENGTLPRGVQDAYIWGDALEELDRTRPDARIVNLETAITTSGEYWPGKGIHYRMHPANAGCLAAARIDCCALANNHVLDWGYGGLAETIDAVHRVGPRAAGAGRNRSEAERPAILDLPGQGRVLVFAIGCETSGIPADWCATEEGPGVALLPELSATSAEMVAGRVRSLRRPGDVVVVSIHWGGNWGYLIPDAQREFAHALIDEAGADVIHGHSSHHPKGIEVYRDRPILYGCGDFLNDYEGISGHDEFRSELTMMYFLTVGAADSRLRALEAVPMSIRRFQLNRAAEDEARWLGGVMNRECAPFGVTAAMAPDRRLVLRWGSKA